MSRRCELTGKGAQVGHKVSHSNIKTKRRFLPNLLNVTLISDALGRSVKLRVSANALKTVDHRGGLDAFLMKAKDDELSPRRSSSSGRSGRSAPPRRDGFLIGACPCRKTGSTFRHQGVHSISPRRRRLRPDVFDGLCATLITAPPA